eukprot:CAMPEP_0184374198 /NCGR_PEP_ID=MMETSP1089-20130417/164906_1 /TAXON_ID=38269 ORGANISM="Gloeochaete wittrockiana, Strain SAG46.84" /NCGR_SAMPLE_ID=MMETSP1089 /ASSEMBLY_ACC=CAM_ASM_000445 /LENGTH=75 /DNA_ID=CAMNT_0026717205 /DNA_START=35 /DNA_END=263 /DNA_ORIENTATION=+
MDFGEISEQWARERVPKLGALSMTEHRDLQAAFEVWLWGGPILQGLKGQGLQAGMATDILQYENWRGLRCEDGAN